MELLKKLTGKNPADYEPVARNMVDNADVNLFKELVNKDDFLFAYIKQNVAKRIFNACDETNFKSLYSFLPYYSPFYDKVFATVLARFDRQNADKKMLELLCTGSEAEKCYATKYFAINPHLGHETILRGFIFSENEFLMENSIYALKSLNDEPTFSQGVEKLKSNDDYEAYSGAKLVSRWGDESQLPLMFDAMKKSSIPEYIALEINTLTSFVDILKTNMAEDAALALCHILSGLGEIISLETIFDLDLLEVLQLLSCSKESYASVVLKLAKDLFNEFATNDEYLFDVDKNTKDEVLALDSFLKTIPSERLDNEILEEAFEDSLFIDFVVKSLKDEETLVSLLDGTNQTVILSALETLKTLGLLKSEYKANALSAVSNENVRAVIEAL